jgi:hypothetical protein
VLTCTQQTYTEQIPRPTQPGQQGPYASTLTVLRRATGLELRPGDDVVQGGLRVLSSPSARIDAAAHIAEQREVLPMALAWALRDDDVAEDDQRETEIDLLDVGLSVTGAAWSWLAALPGRMTERVARPSLGVRALEVTRQQLGVKEIPGPRHEPKILAYLWGCVGHPMRGAAAGGGKRLGLATDETSWCAALVGWADREAAEDGEVVPPWRAACWEIVADARDAGTWRDVSSGYTPKAGDLALYRRAGGDPRRPGNTGHVVRVASGVTAGHFEGIGGNESNAVRAAARSMKDPALVGFRAG